ARFSYLFPTSGSALIQARLKPGLSAAQQADAITWIRQAVKMPMFRLGYGGRYTVSGVPVVAGDLAGTITGSIAGLLGAALAVMAITLLLVFRSRLRLLPLAIALAAVGITFGATSLLGGSLTMASIAVLPILIGLAVDYAIQFQSRAEEARRTQSGTAAGPAIARAASVSAPTIATAALAGPARRARAGAGSAGRATLAAAIRQPGRVLAVGALLAVLGWVADTQTSVQSDVTKLVPSSMPALRDLHLLERVTGVSGEIDVVVHSRSVATPQTIGWMLGYENKLLSHYGYLETKGCSKATLCPALSLP